MIGKFLAKMFVLLVVFLKVLHKSTDLIEISNVMSLRTVQFQNSF